MYGNMFLNSNTSWWCNIPELWISWKCAYDMKDAHNTESVLKVSYSLYEKNICMYSMDYASYFFIETVKSIIYYWVLNLKFMPLQMKESQKGCQIQLGLLLWSCYSYYNSTGGKSKGGEGGCSTPSLQSSKNQSL